MVARLQSDHARVGSLDLHYLRSVDEPRHPSPPVVLIHGLGVSARHMVPAAEQIGLRFPVLVPDLPGTGRSPKPWSVLGIEDLAATLDSFLDEVGVGSAVFGSISFGCQVVIELAHSFPERVQGCILIGPTIDGEARNPVLQVLRLLQDGPREPLGLMPVVARDYLEFGVRRGAITLWHALRDDVLRKLPSIAAPVVVVRGEHDPLVPEAWARDILTRVRNGRFVEIAGAAHAANFSHPREFADLVEGMVLDDLKRDGSEPQ